MLKFYLRHLVRAVRKRPLRPLLLVAVIAMTFALMTVGFSVNPYLSEQEREEIAQRYGKADVTVSPEVTSGSRFLSEEDFRAAFPSYGVTGTYPMPFSAGGETFEGTAADFGTDGEIFDVRLRESVPIPERKRATAALVTRAFAERQKVGVGDELELSVFGRPAVFTVYGISDAPFLGKYDLLTDLDAVIRLLAKDSVFVSVMGDSFRPAGILYIDTGDGVTDGELALIRAAYPDRSVTEVAGLSSAEKGKETLLAVMAMMILIGTVTCAALIVCCFYSIASERAREHELFLTVGTPRRALCLLGCAEMGCYWALGCAAGVLPAFFLGRFLLSSAGCDSVRRTLLPSACVFAAGLLLLTSQLTVTAFFRAVGIAGRKKRRSRLSRHRIAEWGFPLFTAVTLVAVFLLPVRLMFYGGILLILSAMISVCVDAPLVFRKIAGRLGNAKNAGIGRKYAAKNAAAVPVLGNTARLLSVFLLSCAVLTLLLVSAGKYIGEAEGLFAGDAFVTGGGADCGEKIRSAEGEPRAESLLLTDAEFGNHRFTACSVSSVDCFSDRVPLSSLPGAGEFYAAEPMAKRYGWAVGDTVVFRVGGAELPLRLSATVGYNLPFLLFDSRSAGIAHDTYLVSGSEGEDGEEFFGNLTRALSMEIAAVVPVRTLMHGYVEKHTLYLACGEIFTAFLMLFAAIGIALNVADSYRSRRAEFERFADCGMSVRDRRRMIAWELLYTLALGCALAVILFAVSLPGIRNAFRTFGFDLWYL